MSPFILLLLGLLALTVLVCLAWWLLIITEGVYLGRGVVILLYDLYAKRYDGIKQYDPTYEAYFLARPLLSALEDNNAPLVLDVATGTGRLPLALLRENIFMGTVVGLDFSRRMLHQATLNPLMVEALKSGQVHLMHAPAEKLPFPDGCFDVVTCLEALEFMSKPYAVIAELVRVTRPGGLLLLSNRIGEDAALMPAKTWSAQHAKALYTERFGLREVYLEKWQTDYDLVWAKKKGESLPRRARPLPEYWLCPTCNTSNLILATGYQCLHCETQIALGHDGVIELKPHLQ